MSEDNDEIRMVNVRPKDLLSVTQYSSWTIHIHLGLREMDGTRSWAYGKD